MDIKVIKFGGEAMSTPTNQVNISKIIKKTGTKTIVVCSAMGKYGFPYSTDNLKILVEENYVSTKEIARLLSCGETISSIRLSYILNKEGIKAYALSLNELGFICNNNYLDARIIDQNVKKLNELLESYDCLICPGFIGLNNENEVVTLGSNGSDYTAVSIAKNLEIKEIILYKNVNGIFHTPPNVYKQTPLHKNLSYEEMLSLNDIGFNIVMKKAVEEAKESNIKIVVKSYNNESDDYTIISSDSSNQIILGYNVLDKEVKIATFFPCLVKEILEKEFAFKHIFVENEYLSDNLYSFCISKSVNNIVKMVINKQICHPNNKKI